MALWQGLQTYDVLCTMGSDSVSALGRRLCNDHEEGCNHEGAAR